MLTLTWWTDVVILNLSSNIDVQLVIHRWLASDNLRLSDKLMRRNIQSLDAS